MESSQKLDLIHRAIEKLLSDRKSKHESSGPVEDENDQLLLSRLLSELESWKGCDATRNDEPAASAEASNDLAVKVETKKEDGNSEEIVKELRKVRKQNIVTHCLLSVMIVLTVAWQLSEVSLILKVRDGLSHPLRYFGSMLTGMIKGPDASAKEQKEHHTDAPLTFPEIPSVDLGLNGEK